MPQSSSLLDLDRDGKLIRDFREDQRKEALQRGKGFQGVVNSGTLPKVERDRYEGHGGLSASAHLW